MSKIKQVFLAEREAEQIESSFLDDAYHYEVFKSKFNKDGKFVINEPELDLFFRLIGKLNLTYLLIDSYYYFKSLVKTSHSLNKIENYQSILSNKIYQKFYQNR